MISEHPHTTRFLPYGGEKWTIWAKNTIALISTHLVPLFSFNLNLSTSLPSLHTLPPPLLYHYLLMLNSLGLRYTPIQPIFSLSWWHLALPPQQSSRRPYHQSLFNHCKLLSTSTRHWSHSLRAPRLSLRLYRMGSHCASLPRHFWGVHLCQPFCSSPESYTTTLAGFLPTSLDTPLLTPLKVITVDSSV